jgi:outer membrane cobalamin receptor
MAQDVFGVSLPKNSSGVYTNELNNFTENFQMKHDAPVGEKFLLQTSCEFSRGNPISSSVAPAYVTDSLGNKVLYNPADTWQNQKAMGGRYSLEQSLIGKLGKGEIIAGAGFQLHTLRSTTTEGTYSVQYSPDPADTARFIRRTSGFALFQYNIKFGDFHFIAGSRYEITPFGNAFAPRAGMTYNKKKLNIKVLYGRAFRVPLLWQAYSRQFFTQKGLHPEICNTLEFAVGYRFSPSLKVSLNAFWIDITEPITYIGSTNSYQNYGRVGSRGFEGEISWRKAGYGFFANASYCIPTQNTVADFLTEDKKHFLALPRLKLNGGAYWQLKNISFALTFTLLGTRFGQTEFSAQNSTPEEIVYDTKGYSPLLMTNFNLTFAKILHKTDLSLHVYNAFNADYSAIQPYYGGHAPMPVNDRQISVNVIYRF